MFTGIIEQIAEVVKVESEGSNVHISLKSTITSELKIDQSVAHNGVCLTVVKINGDEYIVTAIKETLDKSNIGLLVVGSKVNIERCLKVGDRLDGHMVQGHVDQTAKCVDVKKENGSYVYTFKHKESDNMTVEKGSVCVNGISLTVVNSKDTSFSVAIIPYTHEHTNFHEFKEGTIVNIEFDVLGKYIAKQFMRDA
ncbi:riboflavin synthase [Flavobacteriales bacterium]|jgi:riboflavin synthase|nr:riboflavin synthase [Flavobacteriales bacterium]MDB4250700.1 riboflavin synthase [Flavobacteriales bacterium]MDB9910390.1 riboflavin synthase [Flavobacteriales bacterium]|tara:strand:+ start:95 stop:682 length:588 start_codon:yes stop_codon:yes gene_type:complete